MINPILKHNFPFVSEYFETLIKNTTDRFPQSIVFEGLDIIGQYFFAVELSRILNCTGDKTPQCNCINCKWIKESKHPCTILVTPVDFKDDASKTVISVNQAKKITQTIRESSDYHRFFIFANAKNDTKSHKEKQLLKKYEEINIALPSEDWTPVPLTMKMFKSEASNSLLKSIEEPPKNTTFIFLTSCKEDLISTIVSRSNVFKLAKGKNENKSLYGYEFLKNYPDISLTNALEMSLSLQDLIKSESLNAKDIIDDIEEYLLEFIKNKQNNAAAVNKAFDDIKVLEKAKKRLNASMSTKTVLDSAMMDLASSLD